MTMNASQPKAPLPLLAAGLELESGELTLLARCRWWLYYDSPSWMVSAVFHAILLLVIRLLMEGKRVAPAVEVGRAAAGSRPVVTLAAEEEASRSGRPAWGRSSPAGAPVTLAKELGSDLARAAPSTVSEGAAGAIARPWWAATAEPSRRSGQWPALSTGSPGTRIVTEAGASNTRHVALTRPARAPARSGPMRPPRRWGQTQMAKGPYQRKIAAGIQWLIAHQEPDGDLSAGGPQMYSQGLAAIALCEAYGMTRDSRVGGPAQAAIRFIQSGQNVQGGWRYIHGCDDCDTSVYGWEMMALKSALMAGLHVDPITLEAGRKYLALASARDAGRSDSEELGMFSCTPGGGPTSCMSSVGLLICQYMGESRTSPVITGGVQYLMANLPGKAQRNIYYWYYATQVMHNLCDSDWDTWNRKIRRILVESQCKTGCASGSWDPLLPDKDAWGGAGGRLMVTSLSALTLEVYYRYLPLYQLEGRARTGHETCRRGIHSLKG